MQQIPPPGVEAVSIVATIALSPPASRLMRKTVLALVILALAWIGYLAWPLYELVQIVRAVERGDAAAVARRVDFARMRASLTQQIVEAYLQRSGGRGGALVPGALATVADPIVAKVISPEALAEFMRVGWPRTALPEQPPDVVGISRAGLGTAWQLFAASEYGIGRYEVTVPVTLPPERAFELQLRIARWRWRITALRMPEHIRFLLADEIVKSVRSPQTP
jgi:hypothetical protein